MTDISLILEIAAVVLLFILILLVLFRDKTTALSKKFEEQLRESENELLADLGRRLSESSTEEFKRFEIMQNSLQSSLQNSREESSKRSLDFENRVISSMTALKNENTENLTKSREDINKFFMEFSELSNAKISGLQKDNSLSLEKINQTLENKIGELREGNEKRLAEMQNIVDEKLQSTLETRISQSFELVNKQLESVQRGLGEMQSLAADTKDLKRALINVKERGTYGEVRLEKLLSDILSEQQYGTNVEIQDGKRVEFAVYLPGSEERPLLLPIDSKFPIEDYNRLLDAETKVEIEAARKALLASIRSFAKDIHDKYIAPPMTTDFALMFLPTEGLYAEVVSNAAFFEELRDKFKVTPVGITTLSAFLNSLQIGFKTLALEQRSQEVWDTLRAVKTEFQKFGEVLQRAKAQLRTVDRTLDEAVGVRTRAINRRLRDVEQLPEGSIGLLDEGDIFDEEELL
ncbi:MAG: DNA recombination protein RmuC [Candidatus Scatomorpha sp.]